MTEIADELVAVLQQVLPTPETPVHLFFEGLIKKARNGEAKRVVKMARLRNLLVRRALSPSPAVKRKDRAKWSAAAGRPEWHLTLCVAMELRKRGYQCHGHETVEADELIARWSCHQGGARVAVIGTDSDLLALSPEVDYLVGPWQSNHWLLRREDVLAAVGLTARQLMVLYAAGGCDNVDRVGLRFASVFRFAKSEVQPDATKMDAIAWPKLLKKVADRTKVCEQLSAIWNAYGWAGEARAVKALELADMQEALKSKS